MEQINQKDVERTRKALDDFMAASRCCEDRGELHKHAVNVFSKELNSPGLIKRACEAYNSNKSLYKFNKGFNKDAAEDFAILDPEKVSQDVIGMRKSASVKAITAEQYKPKFYTEALPKTASMEKVASSEEPVNPADFIEMNDSPGMLEVNILNTLNHQRELINKLAFAIDDAEKDACNALEPIQRELGHLSKQAGAEVAEMAGSYYGVLFDGVKDMFPTPTLRKYASAPKLPKTPVFEKIANYMEKAVILQCRKDLLKTAAADLTECFGKLAGAYRLYKLRKQANGPLSMAVGLGLAPAVRETFELTDGDKAKVYDKLLNKNVQNALRELETRRNFYEIYADDYISTFPVDDVRVAYNTAIQKLPMKLKKHPSSATQLIRGWVTKMLSRGNVTSAEDAEDVMNAAVNLRNEGFDLNPYRA